MTLIRVPPLRKEAGGLSILVYIRFVMLIIFVYIRK